MWRSRPISDAELANIKVRDDRAGAIHRIVDAIYADKKPLIEERFPKLNRSVTGYDLAHIRDAQGTFNLNSLLCGAEGTLCFVAEAKLNVLPIPECTAVVNITYAAFDDALRDARSLMQSAPTSIETIDSVVLDLAMNNIVWDSVRDLFPADDRMPIRGINLVEFTADDEMELRGKVDALTSRLEAVKGRPGKNVRHTVAYDEHQIKRVWAMRKEAVGLLGNAEGEKRPIPFVEDTAVPPENLADYIGEFRAVLDRHGLAYGMFGHVDAGVLHVRPAIDMKDPQQERLIRTITDQVVALTNKYGGVLWGEHGKGVRSEYSPAFFGPLYPSLQEIKAVFDPYNQLNRGKICSPPNGSPDLLEIDGVPTRGASDRTIPDPVRSHYAAAMYCNGNAACFNFDPHDAMCPSWKGTRERIHSPKGRASLTREWLRLLAEDGVDPVEESRKVRERSFVAGVISRARNTTRARKGEYDFSHEVHAAMAGCLACKSCATQCPIGVDVAEFRSKFLELYHGRYLRPPKDYVVAGLEYALPLLSRFPAPYNWAMGNHALQRFMRDTIGLIDTPRFSGIDLRRSLDARGIASATRSTMEAMSPDDRAKAVILVQDAFTSYFETQLVLDVVELLQRLGFVPLVAPFKPNGKPLHVHGFLKTFQQAADRNAALLNSLAVSGVPLVGIDPSMTLTYRSEYAKALGTENVPKVLLLQEWLVSQEARLRGIVPLERNRAFKLLAHCTERTNAAPSIRAWQAVFAALGQTLVSLDVGCCGMAGTYGHEARNAATSRRIYALSWAETISRHADGDALVATGYSCRSQVKRIDGQILKHPAQALLRLLPARAAGTLALYGE